METRRKQGKISISRKTVTRTVYDAKEQAQSEYFQDINTMTEIRFLKWLRQSKIQTKM